MRYILDLVLEQDPEAFLNKYPSELPPDFSNPRVVAEALAQLDDLPELEHVRPFQKCYEESNEIPEVKRYYVDAGRAMLCAYMYLDDLKKVYHRGRRPKRVDFQYPALSIAVCIAEWYKCIGTPEFQQGQDKRRAIRLQYIKYAVAVVYAIGKIIVPPILQAWVEDLGELLHGDYFDELFILDSQITYERIRASWDGELFQSPESMPAFYITRAPRCCVHISLRTRTFMDFPGSEM